MVNGVGKRLQPVQCMALPMVDVLEERLGSKQTNTKAVSLYGTEIKGMINSFFLKQLCIQFPLLGSIGETMRTQGNVTDQPFCGNEHIHFICTKRAKFTLNYITQQFVFIIRYLRVHKCKSVISDTAYA